MKKYIIFSFALLCYLNIFSQCISIELSIHWKNEENVFIKGDTVCTPYLNIIYRNNTSNSVYFLGVSKSYHYQLPGLPGALIQYKEWPSTYERAYSHSNWSKYSYNVNIGHSSDYLQGWETVKDTIREGIPYNEDAINNDLFNIYWYMSDKFDPICHKKENGTVYLDFKSSDIVEDSILTKLKERFIFLKPGKSYIDSYNLMAFKIVGGTFNFRIRPTYLNDYVYVDSGWNENEKRWEYSKKDLPKKVGEYNLYSGDFYTNEVSIKCIDRK